MTRSILYEACAGQACLSLSFVAGRPTPPAWARPGNKVGYAAVIQRAAGLVGWKPSRIVLAEPAADCRVMLAAYSRPDVLRGAAEHLRKWGAEAGEDGQRALWKRLKDEGPPDEGAADMAREVARVAAVQRRTVNQAAVRAFGGGSDGNWRPLFQKSEHNGSISGKTRSYRNDSPAEWMEPASLLCWPPVTLLGDAGEIEVGADGVLYVDGPYEGTHGYGGAEFGRDAQLALARRADAAGALVLVSEAVPLADALGDGWYSIDIGGEYAHPTGRARSGANRGCVSEWLTLNQPPAPGWRTATQTSLFGGAR